ncbi:MAG: YdcH family protein [Aquificaceae bacterium]|nr:YdcH family protein [Aquificaceae bacterium]
MNREEIIQKLLQENKEFKYHYEKHHELDAKIDKLEKHHPMTHELEMEIETLKKERLYHRDMMEAIISQYMKAHT